jgi:hypothetical protein
MNQLQQYGWIHMKYVLYSVWVVGKVELAYKYYFLCIKYSPMYRLN